MEKNNFLFQCISSNPSDVHSELYGFVMASVEFCQAYIALHCSHTCIGQGGRTVDITLLAKSPAHFWCADNRDLAWIWLLLFEVWLLCQQRTSEVHLPLGLCMPVCGDRGSAAQAGLGGGLGQAFRDRCCVKQINTNQSIFTTNSVWAYLPEFLLNYSFLFKGYKQCAFNQQTD